MSDVSRCDVSKCDDVNKMLSFKLDEFCDSWECLLECKKRYKSNKTAKNCPVKTFVDYVSPLIENLIHKNDGCVVIDLRRM